MKKYNNKLVKWLIKAISNNDDADNYQIVENIAISIIKKVRADYLKELRMDFAEEPEATLNKLFRI